MVIRFAEIGPGISSACTWCSFAQPIFVCLPIKPRVEAKWRVSFSYAIDHENLQ